MVRDGGDHALEAGALVMGDQGVCCIDEFDKMGNQHCALLEAMEQQSISIAKSGMVCTLSARTSVIAAANPVGGHYNRSKTIAENIKMNGPLLSRFDLLFLLLDTPDAGHDLLLSRHVMQVLLIPNTLFCYYVSFFFFFLNLKEKCTFKKFYETFQINLTFF